jgi:hypothetical protein
VVVEFRGRFSRIEFLVQPRKRRQREGEQLPFLLGYR